jgi:hypothetical protein
MNPTDKKIMVVLRDLTQLVIGYLVEETDQYYKLDKACMVAISPGQTPGQISIQFAPMDLLSFNPPVSVKSLCDDNNVDETVTISKTSLLRVIPNVRQEILDQYHTQNNPSAIITPTPSVAGDEGKIVKLFE